MKRRTALAICLSIAIIGFALGIVRVVYAPVHWGGGRIDIKPAPTGEPKIEPCPSHWGGGRIDIKAAPAGVLVTI